MIRLGNICFALLIGLIPSTGFSQARQNLTLARVIYNTLKTTAKPQGELKDRIDALEKELGESTRAGRTGEVRRLLAKGTALLQGKEWTDALEFSTSLALRAEEVYVDSSKPYTIRVEQIYPPKTQLAGSLVARASIHKAARAGRIVLASEKVKDLAALDGVGRDFQDEPCRLELDLAGIEDGTYVVQVEILEKENSVGKTTLMIDLRQGLSDRLGKIDSELKNNQGFDSVRGDVLYPLDYIRNVNRGRVEIGTFEIEKELASAEQILTSLKAGKDPFAGRTGDMERHHRLEGADEIMPYRVFVPTKYTGRAAFPLIIALHGLGANEDSFFDSYGKQFPKLAEEHGYIVASPLGYRVDGAYGMNLFRQSDDVSVKRKLEYSEKDVMAVLDLMKKSYKIDDARIYLTGHSMGAIGTWYLGAKYPEIWAALAPCAGYGIPDTVQKMKHIPQIVVHGDADPTVPVGGSRAMVAKMKELGVENQYIEVPGGNHIDVVMPNFPAIFDFFDKHRKQANP